ncbi:MAG: hypothetical protein GVY26_01780 [Bacteroidetes bacterium]|jgi:hypothetical protein|nr:hypothetical protein [Bacteroidota bacterium]
MRYPELAQQIIDLQTADQQLRDQLARSGQLGQGYNEAMQRLHNQNATHLAHIIDGIGYPTVERVGEAANAAAWLVIQHAIGQPPFMRKCLQLLEEAVAEQQADHKHLAYLSDRIAVLAGQPQRYGTQFDWDEQGKLSPNTCDDRAAVDRRRATLGLNSLAEQTRLMRKRAAAEQQQAPANFQARKREMDAWRKKTGWV